MMNRGYPFILGAAIVYGVSNVVIKLLYIYGISAYILALATQAVIVAILFPFVRKELRHLTAPTSRFFLQYGAITSIMLLSFLGSVYLDVPLGIVIMLFYTQSIWVVLFSRVILNETITKGKAFASALSVVGVSLLVNVLNLQSVSSAGVVLGLGSGLALSLWVIWGKKSRNNKFSPAFTDFTTRGFTLLLLIFLLPFFLVLDPKASSISYNIGVLPITLLFGLGVAQVIPDLLFYSGVKLVNAVTATVMLLWEPVTTIGLSIAFLAESLTPTLVVGAFLILLANYILIRGRVSREEVTDSKDGRGTRQI